MDDERAFSILLTAVQAHGPHDYQPDLIESIGGSPRSDGHADEVIAALIRIIEQGAMDNSAAAKVLACFPRAALSQAAA